MLAIAASPSVGRCGQLFVAKTDEVAAAHAWQLCMLFGAFYHQVYLYTNGFMYFWMTDDAT
jgi:hypothetical protein